MELKDLIKSVSEMTDDELLEHVSRVRSQRVIRATPAKRAASTRRKGAVTKGKLTTLLESMPQELREELLKKYGGSK